MSRDSGTRGGRMVNEYTKKRERGDVEWSRRGPNRSGHVVDPDIQDMLSTPQRAFAGLSVVRQVSRDQGGLTDDWHEWLDTTGAKNLGAGNVKTLGSLAVVYAPAQEVNRMYSEKYPRLVNEGSKEKVRDFYRDVAKNIAAFTRDTIRSSFDETTDAQERAYAILQQGIQCGDVSNELIGEDLIEITDQFGSVVPGSTPSIPPQPLMGAGSFHVGGVKFLNDGYALDLTENEQLYTERHNFVQFLKMEERLNTSRMERNWDPSPQFIACNGFKSALSINEELRPHDMVLDAVKPIVV